MVAPSRKGRRQSTPLNPFPQFSPTNATPAPLLLNLLDFFPPVFSLRSHARPPSRDVPSFLAAGFLSFATSLPGFGLLLRQVCLDCSLCPYLLFLASSLSLSFCTRFPFSDFSASPTIVEHGRSPLRLLSFFLPSERAISV